ncbi:hypothetical protein GQ473_01520 [archaeon]|nr:hypothetical protein [archaeon]
MKEKKKSLFEKSNNKIEVDETAELKQNLLKLGLLKEKEKPPSFFKKLILLPSIIIKTIISVRDVKSPRALANRLFSNITQVYPEYFNPLKKALEISDIKLMPQTYIGIMTASSFIVSMSAFLIILLQAIWFKLSIELAIFGLLIVPAASFFLIFLIFYIYPFQSINQKRKSIDTNLPFAINHMSAIASSGVPPEKAFEMLVEFGDYGGITEESKMIVRRIKVMGEDITSAIHYVAKKTPSESFKELLYGILSIIESGGNLKDYLSEMSEIALFNYKLSRKRYVETLSTYADIYTVILIAVPMFLVSILAVMNIIPDSNVGGMSIIDFMKLGVYGMMPIMNLGFLAFLIYTQPDM